MSLSSNELNYLIWRYLQESGFELTSFALQQEAEAHLPDEKLGLTTPLGALVRLVQKGIRLTEIEADVRRIGRDDTDKRLYTLVRALELDKELLEEPKLYTNGKHVERNGDVEMKSDSGHQDENIEAENSKPESHTASVQVQAAAPKEPLVLDDLEKLYDTAPAACSEWSPESKNLLAVASADLKVALLLFENDNFSAPQQLVLHHNLNPGTPEKQRQITCISWNCSGSLVATATFDGSIRLWTSDGKLRHVLSLHRAPVMAIKWNKSGSLLLTADCLNMVVVWDAFSGDVRQHFQHDSNTSNVGADATWIDGVTYATTGENTSILIYKVGERLPLLKFHGHTQTINSLQFDQNTLLLASASDDCTLRIWHGKSTSSIATLVGHPSPVLVSRWIPVSALEAVDPTTGGGILVSGSIDGTIKVWRAEQSRCLATFSLHEGAIFFLEVSPNGQYFASAGADGLIVVWNAVKFDAEGEATGTSQRALAKYQPNKTLEDAETNPVATLSWNADSTKLFASYQSGSVVLNVPAT